MSVRAIGFDYGGVISAQYGPDFNKNICAILSISEEDYKNTYHSINYLINEGHVDSWPEFWGKFLEIVDRSDKYNELITFFNDVSTASRTIDSTMVNLIDQVRKSYKVGLLSNNTREMGEWLRLQNLHTHFDVFHISAETGLMKPRPAAFIKFTTELKVNPDQLIFIDDSKKSLSTAEQVGFTPILFKNASQLKKDLKQLRII